MKRGFTLVEVTVALALFAVATVVLTQSFLGGMFSLESFKFDNKEDDAVFFVYDKVISLGGKADIENGGTIDTVINGMAKWSGAVASTDVLGLYRVTVNVSFENEKFSTKKKNYQEEFYVYRPGWPVSAEHEASLKKKKESKPGKDEASLKQNKESKPKL